MVLGTVIVMWPNVRERAAIAAALSRAATVSIAASRPRPEATEACARDRLSCIAAAFFARRSFLSPDRRTEPARRRQSNACTGCAGSDLPMRMRIDRRQLQHADLRFLGADARAKFERHDRARARSRADNRLLSAQVRRESSLRADHRGLQPARMDRCRSSRCCRRRPDRASRGRWRRVPDAFARARSRRRRDSPVIRSRTAAQTGRRTRGAQLADVLLRRSADRRRSRAVRRGAARRSDWLARARNGPQVELDAIGTSMNARWRCRDCANSSSIARWASCPTPTTNRCTSALEDRALTAMAAIEKIRRASRSREEADALTPLTPAFACRRRPAAPSRYRRWSCATIRRARRYASPQPPAASRKIRFCPAMRNARGTDVEVLRAMRHRDSGPPARHRPDRVMSAAGRRDSRAWQDLRPGARAARSGFAASLPARRVRDRRQRRGKSTLLRILAGLEAPSCGTRAGLRTGHAKTRRAVSAPNRDDRASEFSLPESDRARESRILRRAVFGVDDPRASADSGSTRSGWRTLPMRACGRFRAGWSSGWRRRAR